MNRDQVIVVYLIVNDSLNMSAGKIAAQCAHATQNLLLSFNKLKQRYSHGLNLELPTIPQEIMSKLSIVDEWLSGEFTKIVLKASQQEFEAIKQEYQDCFVIKDNGHTEVSAGSETVIALWPMKKADASNTIKAMKLLR